MNTVVIETADLTKQFGELTAVNRLNLSIEKGELFGLLGPNGSGKTTTVKLLTGQLKPTHGGATVLGTDVRTHPIDVRKVVGIIPEQETPPSFLTAEEYLSFVARIRNLDRVEARIDHCFSFLEFEDQRSYLCKDLSRGTRQKLMFAQAFLHEPELAFVDEPLINLDPILQKKVKDFLVHVTQEGRTVFFSTHVLEIAEEICTTIGILYKGELIYHGTIDDVQTQNEHLEAFFLNLVSNERKERKAGR
jgi:ABC-2 type transport system ATP-binding protein